MNVPYRIPLAVSTDGIAVNLGIQEPQSVDLSMSVGVYAQIGEHYHGAYTVTPTNQAQVLDTDALILDGNITINPIPSNYGLISWDGSTITVS
jgi:hypothetical protein